MGWKVFIGVVISVVVAAISYSVQSALPPDGVRPPIVSGTIADDADGAA
jgi:hypothetical protein